MGNEPILIFISKTYNFLFRCNDSGRGMHNNHNPYLINSVMGIITIILYF